MYKRIVTLFIYLIFCSLFPSELIATVKNDILARYKVVGLISASNHKNSVAVIKDQETHKTLTLSIGMKLATDQLFKITQIADREVTVSNGKDFFTLDFGIQQGPEEQFQAVEELVEGDYYEEPEESEEEIGEDQPTVIYRDSSPSEDDQDRLTSIYQILSNSQAPIRLPPIISSEDEEWQQNDFEE